MKNPRIEYERIEVKLEDGTTVLGKEYRARHAFTGRLIPGGMREYVARTYSNRTQAQQSAAKHPGSEVIRCGRPFYVMLHPSPAMQLAMLQRWGVAK